MYQRFKNKENEGYFDQLLKFVDQHLVETEVTDNGQINSKKEKKMFKETTDVNSSVTKPTPMIVQKEDIRQSAVNAIETSAMLSYSPRDYAYSAALIYSKLYELETKGELVRVVIRLLDTLFNEYKEEAMNCEYPEGSIPHESMAYKHFCDEVLKNLMAEFFGEVDVSRENFDRGLIESGLNPADYDQDPSS